MQTDRTSHVIIDGMQDSNPSGINKLFIDGDEITHLTLKNALEVTINCPVKYIQLINCEYASITVKNYCIIEGKFMSLDGPVGQPTHEYDCSSIRLDIPEDYEIKPELNHLLTQEIVRISRSSRRNLVGLDFNRCNRVNTFKYHDFGEDSLVNIKHLQIYFDENGSIPYIGHLETLSIIGLGEDRLLEHKQFFIKAWTKNVLLSVSSLDQGKYYWLRNAIVDF